jgi:hypothetical protein
MQHARTLALLALAAACGRGPEPRGGVPSLADASAPGAKPAESAHVRITERASAPAWLAAREGDAMALARLADVAGASGLLEGVEDGGDVRHTALLALPYAEDADVALGRLAERALTEQGADRQEVLTAMLGVAHRQRDQREPLDLEGARRAFDIALALSQRASLAPEDRALAGSIARALAERGFGDAAKVP